MTIVVRSIAESLVVVHSNVESIKDLEKEKVEDLLVVIRVALGRSNRSENPKEAS